MIELTIDGKVFAVQPGTSVMEAALSHGIEIPHLCYHPELSVPGSCRLCVVEVEGRECPTLSCELECKNGMVVQTQSPLLFETRKQILDLLISEHPLDCVICDKAGVCLLQKYAYQFGLKNTSYEFKKTRSLYQDDNPFFIRDHQYCILCGRCVRVCDEIVGANVFDFAGRGNASYIATPFDSPMNETPCVFCGSCVQVCPTATLMPVARMGKGREWDFDRTKTICGYCGVGCQIEYTVRNGNIVYAESTPQAPVNGEFLCVKGRFGWDFASDPDRLTHPLLRRDLAYELGITEIPWDLPEQSPLEIQDPNLEDRFIAIDWDTAFDIVADKLASTVETHGPDAVMGLASARCTNEENYLFQKFMRVGIGTNNIDHCARL